MGKILPLPTASRLRGFVGYRIFSTKTDTVPGKPGEVVTLHVTEHVTGLDQSDDFSWKPGACGVSVHSLQRQLWPTDQPVPDTCPWWSCYGAAPPSGLRIK